MTSCPQNWVTCIDPETLAPMLMDSRRAIDLSIFVGVNGIPSLLSPEGPRVESSDKLSRATKRQYFRNSSEVASCTVDAAGIVGKTWKNRAGREGKWRREGGRCKGVDVEKLPRSPLPVPLSVSIWTRPVSFSRSQTKTVHGLHSAAPFNPASFQNLGFHTRASSVVCAAETREAAGFAKSFKWGGRLARARGTVTHYAVMWGHVADAADPVWLDGSLEIHESDFFESLLVSFGFLRHGRGESTATGCSAGRALVACDGLVKCYHL